MMDMKLSQLTTKRAADFFAPAALLLIIFLAVPALAQQTFDARSAGMAFSNGADTRGLDHIGLNPATLALPTSYNFEFNLISANVNAGNNGLTKEQYDSYFTVDDYFLSDDNKQDILNEIKAEGLRIRGRARVMGLAFYMPNFSLSINGYGLGRINVPRDAIELALRGNADEGRTYSFNESDGIGITTVDVRLSGAYPFKLANNAPIRFAAAGMTLRYISGLKYGNIEDFEGEFRNFSLDQNRAFMGLDGRYSAVSAEGGSGIAADLGGLVTLRDQDLSIGLTFTNIVGAIRWDTDTERRLYSIIDGDSLRLPDGIPDSITTSRSVPISDFTTNLARTMDLSLAWRFKNGFMLSSTYEQGFTNNIGGTTDPRFAFGVEYSGLSVLPLRAGISMGGNAITAVALGFGLDLKYWFIDAAFVNRGGFFPGGSSKNITLAVTSRLRF